MGNGRNQVSHQPVEAFAELTAGESFPRGKQKTTDLTKFSVFFGCCLFLKLFMPSCEAIKKHHFYDKIGFVLQYRENA